MNAPPPTHTHIHTHTHTHTHTQEKEGRLSEDESSSSEDDSELWRKAKRGRETARREKQPEPTFPVLPPPQAAVLPQHSR